MKNKTNILEKVKLFFQVYGANYYIGVEHSSEDKNKIQNLFHNYGCLPRIGLFEEVNETFFKFQTSLARFTEGINCYHFVDLTFNENKLEEEDSEKKAKEKTPKNYSLILKRIKI